MRGEHDWAAYVRRYLPPLRVRPEREADIVAELAEGFEQAFQDALRAGLTDAEAAQAACGRVKDWRALAAELTASNVEPARLTEPPAAGSLTEGFWRDIRFALRSLRLDAGFAAVAIATLAFGIGSNTAIFTVVDHIALRGLPYPGSGRLLSVEQTRADQPEVDSWGSIDNLLAIRARSKTLQNVAGISPVWSVVMTGEGDAERLETLFVSADFFSMLGVRPALGRLFTAEEDDRAKPANVAVLSHAFWTRRFGASPGVVGRTLRIDNRAVTVIGVLPREFRWLGEPLAGSGSMPDFWAPLAANPMIQTPRMVRFLKLAARLRPSASLEQARRELAEIHGGLAKEFPEERMFSFSLFPLEARTHGRLRPAVYLLLATIGFVLLMVSANVSNLMLAKASTRSRELVVRVALGATPWRLLRQLLTESLVVAACGGVGGLALAFGFIRMAAAYGPPEMVGSADIALDGRALWFTGGVILAAAFLAGLAPSWRAAGGNRAGVLRESRGNTARNRWARMALAATQIAMAVALVAGCGLLTRSLLRVLAVDPGFDSKNVLSISTQLPPGTPAAMRTAIYNRIRESMLATPGVADVGAVSRLPLSGQNLGTYVFIEGREVEQNPPEVEFRAATASYFATMRIPLVSGRMFEERDNAEALELIVDSLTVARHFPGQDPIGRRMRLGPGANAPWWTVVGVVGSTRHFGLDADPRPTVYRHVSTNPLNSPILVIRTQGDPGPMVTGLSRAVRESHAGMPAYNIFSMEELVARSTSQRRFLMWLMGAFASGALLLAGIGVYGAVSQAVAQRRQELGVRVALGAPAASVAGLVMAEGLRVLAIGLAAGLAMSLIGARLVRGLLFGVAPQDPLVFTGAVLLVSAGALLACLGPAWRAARLDPLETLRASST